MADGERERIQHLDSPWRNRELMESLYVEEKMSQTQIAKQFGCSPSTVRNWLKKHGFDIRGISEAKRANHGPIHHPRFKTREWDGAEIAYTSENSEYKKVRIHRLVAVAVHGFDAVCGKQVHHKSGIPWDNRPSNLEVLTNSEHQSKHRKLTWEDKVEIYRKYQNPDVTHFDLAEEYDIHRCTAGEVVREVEAEVQG